jgi:WD40 repeat protein
VLSYLVEAAAENQSTRLTQGKENNMNDVFISYSRRDKVFTQKLFDALKAANRDVWADWEDIPASSDWDAEIKQGIQETNSVLFVLSPEWIKSNECRKELVHAVSMGKRLFPILYLPVDPNDVPPELAKINWVYMRDTDDFDKALQTLCSAMDTDLDWIKTHTRIQVRALEWERKNRDHSFVLRGNDLTEGEQFIAGAANKSPVPTALQSEYILASRMDATRRQRQTLAGVTVALVISIVLAVAAFIQRQAATSAKATAEFQRNNAVVARNTAIAAESTAVSAKETAVANEKEAIRQSKISRSGELAIQSISNRDGDFQLSLLLGIESFRSSDTYRARATLLDNININPQLRHFFPISGDKFTLSPDGRILATSSNGYIRLWDVNAHQEIGQPMGWGGIIYAVSFSPDGKLLAFTFRDEEKDGVVNKTITLWDVETQKQIGQPLKMQTTSLPIIGFGFSDIIPDSLVFSPDSKTLASTNRDDNTIILWNIETQQKIGQLLNDFYSISFSPDGNTLALSSTAAPTIIFLDAKTLQRIGQPLEGTFPLAYSPDGQILASGGKDHTIILWDIKKRQQIGQLSGSNSSFYSFEFSSDGKTIASAPGSAGNPIILWDVETHQQIQEFKGGNAPIVFSPDGKTLMSMYGSKIVRWDNEKYEPLNQMLVGHEESIFSVAFSPDGKTLASGSADKTIILWDSATHKQIGQPLKLPDLVFSVVFSQDSKILVSTSADNTIVTWDVATHKQIGQSFKGSNPIAFSPDGKTLASGGKDNTILLWDVGTHQQIGEPFEGSNPIAFSPDGKTLASTGKDNTILLWDVATHQFIGHFLGGDYDNLQNIAFSIDGKTLATLLSRQGALFPVNTIVLWNVKTGEEISQPKEIPSATTIVFNPDGKTLVSASRNGTINLWDLETLQPIGQGITSEHFQLSFYSIAFSPDGKTLASTSGDPAIMLWNLDPKSWIEESCQRVGRNFTREEWVQYGFTETYRKTCEQWTLEPEVTATPTATP